MRDGRVPKFTKNYEKQEKEKQDRIEKREKDYNDRIERKQ